MGDLLHTHFPYCLSRQSDGSYLLLNREHQPIGLDASADRKDHASRVRLPEIDEATAARLSWNDSPDTSRIYLYNDGTNPIGTDQMAPYLDRIAALIRMRADEA